MSRQTRRRDESTLAGQDAFLDIVTNIVGALFFVVMFAALSSLAATGKVTTPLLTSGETKGVIFECRGNTVFHPAFESLQQQSWDAWEQSEKDGTKRWSKRVERLKAANIGNAFYTYSPEERQRIVDQQIMHTIVDVFMPTPGSRGDRASELQAANSGFHRALATFDPQKHHIFFLVRSDSFEVFHAARRLAIQ